MTKICKKCGYNKVISEFNKNIRMKDGLTSSCAACERKYKKEYYKKNKERISETQKEYYKKTRDKKLKYQREYQKNNQGKIKEYKKKYRIQNEQRVLAAKKKYREENKEKISKQQRENYQKNKHKRITASREYYYNNQEKIKEYRQKTKERKNYLDRMRRKNNPQYRLASNIRRRIHYVITRDGGTKCDKTLELLGCSIAEFRKYIEEKFLEGMSWDNYGFYGWHIDHIKPCDAFDLTDPSQKKECFHYTNLQPLWASDNLSKGNKY
jgi:hypothetical protein